jgi:HEAT repeat protein/Tfp pilus assembly protein PilV
MSHKYAMNYNSAHPGTAQRGFSLRLMLALLVMAVGASAFSSQVAGQQLSSRNTLNRLAQQGGNDAASVIFRGGRDLITDQQWTKAEEKFSQYTSNYPNEKNVDAALYWMAYSEYQLKKYDQCKTTLTRVLNNYEKSSWKDDARTLLAQLPGYAPSVSIASTYNVYAQTPQTPEPARIARPLAPSGEPLQPMEIHVNPEVWATMAAQGKISSLLDEWGEKAADDDPCEFRIVVLQALFQSDVQRGISAATEWLNAGSTQTVRCKGAALSLLARNGGKAVTPVILGVAQREPDLRLRARAISALGITSDDSVIDPLRDFALNSQDSSIVEAALYSLGQHTGPRAIPVLTEIAMSSKPASVRRIAIASIANRKGEPSVDALLKIYDTDQTLEIRKSVIAGLGHRISNRAGEKLLEIAHGSDNIELRKAAISGIASRGGEGSLDKLLSLYDSEKSEELKDRIINSIGPMNDTRVTRKLIEIAKNPQSPIERRKRVIGWLSRSKDPAVTKFLEDLLK